MYCVYTMIITININTLSADIMLLIDFNGVQILFKRSLNICSYYSGGLGGGGGIGTTSPW